MNAQIVVFSWTGNTAACAVALQKALGIEAFLLEEEKPREGPQGFALGGFQSSMKLKTKLKALPDITNADTLILGMPVWAGSIPPAIRTFFQHCSCAGKKVYIFATQQSNEPPKRLEEKLKKIVAEQEGTFMHLFALRVPHGKQLSVDEAAIRAKKWAERINSGE